MRGDEYAALFDEFTQRQTMNAGDFEFYHDLDLEPLAYQFILKKRLITARTVLRSGPSVMDACMGCSFNDYSNFLKAFKREFGRCQRSSSRCG